MENASKALLMAAAVLIGVIVLSLIIYLYSTFSQAKRDNMELINQNQIVAFNAKYLSYDEREDLTYYDIANIATMVKNDNEKNDLNIIVKIGKKSTNYASDGYNDMMEKLYNQSTIDDSANGNNSEIMKKYTKVDLRTGLAQEAKALVHYTCKVNFDNTGRVSNVNFTRNNK